MNTPIYDQLARERGVYVPDPLDPVATLLPADSVPRPPRHAAHDDDTLEVVDPNMFPSGEAA